MSSHPIFVGIRVRSVPSTDPADTIKLDPSGSGKLQLTTRLGDEEPKKVDQVWASSASQTDIWEKVGERGYEAAVTKKQHACIVVWGGTQSGKSHTCLGEGNGLVHGAMRALAGKDNANLTVVLVTAKDQIQDLLTPKFDNMRIKTEDAAGVIFEGSSTVKIPTVDVAKAHLDKCLANRDEIFKTTPNTPDSVFTVYHFGLGEGSFTIVECCASDRNIYAETTPEQAAENKSRFKLIQSVTRCILDMAVNADCKAIDWKGTKPARFLQPAGSQAMEGDNGWFAVVVCIDPRRPATIETQINCTLAEGFVKQESLKTIGEYKEDEARFQERKLEIDKQKPGLIAAAKSAESHMLKVKAENADKAKELSARVEELKTLVPRTEAQLAAEMEKFKKEIEKQRADHIKFLDGEEDMLKNIGKNSAAAIESESKRQLATVTDALLEQQKVLMAKMKDAEADMAKQKDIVAQADRLRAEAREKEKDAMKPVKELQKEVEKLKKELEGAGPCREDGLADDEIARMIPIWEARDELDQVDKEMMEVAQEACRLDYIHSRKFGAPSDSDSDDSDSSDSSDSPSEKERRAKEEREEAEREAAAEKARQEEAHFEKEHAFVKDAVYREKFLHDLVDKVMCYLEYGTNVAVLTQNGFKRHFLYMTRNRKQLALVQEVAEGQVPVKKEPLRVIPIEQIASMVMGQHSPNFTTFLKKIPGRADPPRHEAPPAPEDLAPANMHRYYYRSFSLIMKRDTEEALDIICDTQTDFEALVVAYNRLTRRDTSWGKRMFIDLADRVEELKPFERKLCEDLHLTPSQYLTAKEKVLADPETLFMTLHDMRLLTTLDLYHCQCLMDVFLAQKWVAVRDLVYFKYWEDPYLHRDGEALGEGGADAADGGDEGGGALDM